MAGTKISDLPSASTLTGAELVPVVQSDVTKKTTVSDIAAAVGAGTVTSVNVSGGATGLTATGGPITTSGTITLGGTLDVDNGGTGATTAANARTNLGAAASGANSDITSMTGVTGGISTPDFIQFDTAAGATTAVGKEYWDDNSGGLSYGMKGGNVTQNTGQQIYQRVYNNTGSTIAKGSVVYATGSSGTRTTIAKALATSDGTSRLVRALAAVVAPVPPLSTSSVPPRVIVPDVVIGPPVAVNPVVPPDTLTDVTVPMPGNEIMSFTVVFLVTSLCTTGTSSAPVSVLADGKSDILVPAMSYLTQKRQLR